MATVLDLRGPGPVGPTGLPQLTDQVIVLDDTKNLLRNAETYLAVVGDLSVDMVICVAIGESSTDNRTDGVALSVPPALRDEAVLWVGESQGMDWTAPGTAPRRPNRPTDSLAELVSALQVRRVFTWVWQTTRDLPGRAASPGILLAFGPVDRAALADAGAAAIEELRTGKPAPSRALSDKAIQLDAEHDPQRAGLSGPLDRAVREATGRPERVRELLGALERWHDPAGQARAAAALGTEVSRAGQSAENLRRYVAELLNRMDGHLQNGRPPADEVMELGVPEPVQERGAEVATGLRQLVGGRLDGGAPLPTLAEELRITAAYAKPQGVGRALNQLRRLDPLGLGLPDFPRWPVPLAVLPVAALACFAMAYLPGRAADGPGLGAVLAVLWFAAGWWLLANRPRSAGRDGLGPTLPAAAGAYGLAGGVGVVAGAVLGQFYPDPAPISFPLVLFVALIALTVALVAVTWRGAVRRWRAALTVEEVGDAVARLHTMVNRALLDEWLPMRRRGLIAAAAASAAAELEGMLETLDDVGDGLFTAAGATGAEQPDPRSTAQPTQQELFAIVRGDLVRLCHATLEPLWPAVEAGRPPETRDQGRLEHLLVEYDAGITAQGLMWTPDKAESHARTALLERVYALETVRRAMRAQPADEMRQLCGSRQLSYLSGSAPPSLVRFAPAQLRLVLEEHPAERPVVEDPGIEWNEHSELIGAVRLVQMRPGAVRCGWGEF